MLKEWLRGLANNFYFLVHRRKRTTRTTSRGRWTPSWSGRRSSAEKYASKHQTCTTRRSPRTSAACGRPWTTKRGSPSSTRRRGWGSFTCASTPTTSTGLARRRPSRRSGPAPSRNRSANNGQTATTTEGRPDDEVDPLLPSPASRWKPPRRPHCQRLPPAPPTPRNPPASTTTARGASRRTSRICTPSRISSRCPRTVRWISTRWRTWSPSKPPRRHPAPTSSSRARRTFQTCWARSAWRATGTTTRSPRTSRRLRAVPGRHGRWPPPLISFRAATRGPTTRRPLAAPPRECLHPIDVSTFGFNVQSYLIRFEGEIWFLTAPAAWSSSSFLSVPLCWTRTVWNGSRRSVGYHTYVGCEFVLVKTCCFSLWFCCEQRHFGMISKRHVSDASR